MCLKLLLLIHFLSLPCPLLHKSTPTIFKQGATGTPRAALRLLTPAPNFAAIADLQPQTARIVAPLALTNVFNIVAGLMGQ